MDTACPQGERWRGQLSALLDGEGEGIDMIAVGRHVDACPACSTWLDRAMVVNVGLRELPVVQPTLGDRVVDAVDVRLCGCDRGEACLCGNCQCGPHCTCHAAS